MIYKQSSLCQFLSCKLFKNYSASCNMTVSFYSISDIFLKILGMSNFSNPKSNLIIYFPFLLFPHHPPLSHHPILLSSKHKAEGNLVTWKWSGWEGSMENGEGAMAWEIHALKSLLSLSPSHSLTLHQDKSKFSSLENWRKGEGAQ